MSRGRKRKNNPKIPAHIDQSKLPKGIYWDDSGNGRWFVIEPKPEGGHRTKTVGGPTRLLSELHAIMEERKGSDARGTIGYVMAEFRNSVEYAQLGETTREDYKLYEDQIREVKTKTGALFHTSAIDRLQTWVFQRLNEKIALGTPETSKGAGDGIPGYPTKANHWQRYLRRVLAWGKRNGHCTTNPAAGVKLAKERKRHRMPEQEVYIATLKFARVACARTPHKGGSCPPYIWMVMELAYLCRMRGLEVIRLTDAHATAEGLLVSRVKGSRDNIVRWTPRLRAVWNAVLALRSEILSRPRNAKRPIPLLPQDRFVFLSRDGDPLSKSAFNQAWQAFIHLAMDEGIVDAKRRFSPHGLKHRGVTDSKGTRADKQQASGHKSEAMLDTYDHEVPVVDTAVAPDYF